MLSARLLSFLWGAFFLCYPFLTIHAIERGLPSPFFINNTIQSDDKPIEINAETIVINAPLISSQAIRLRAKAQIIINAPLRSPEIYLQSEHNLKINQEINASTQSETGGKIYVLAREIELFAPAVLEASGLVQGGEIFIGGDFKGLGKLSTAKQTTIYPTVIVRSNGAELGGKVIVWSDEDTQFHGHIQATGHTQGGFVEVSSKNKLTFQGNVDVAALAPTGQQGTILLDPTDLIIGAVDSPAGTLSDNQILQSDTPTTITVSATTLGSLSGSIILQASHDIIFNQSVNFLNAGTVLQAIAGNQVQVNTAITTSQDVTINFKAGMGIVGGGDITTKGGSVSLTTTNGHIVLGTIDSSTDNTTALTNGGDITISAQNGGVTLANLYADSDFSSSVAGSGGDIVVEANNDIDVNIVTGKIITESKCTTPCVAVGMGGNIRFASAMGQLSLGELQSRSFVVGSTINVNTAGSIILDAPVGDINANNIDATSRTTGTGIANNAGNITINSGGNVLTGSLDASSISSVDTGQAGIITLNIPNGLASISNADVRSLGVNGAGGTIQILTDSLEVSGGVDANVSMDATGGNSSGLIQITLKNPPFVVGSISGSNRSFHDIKSGSDLIDDVIPPNNFSTSYNIGNIFINFALTVSTTADSGIGSLRQAILDANASAGRDRIEFNLAGACPQTIALSSVLPSISESLVIDGYTQPSSTQNTLAMGSGNNANLCVVLDGSGIVGPSDGLNFSPPALNSLVQGLVINHFSTSGISSFANNLQIQGNFIGIDQAGTSSAGNGVGLYLDAETIDIGGTYPAASNVISGNTSHGIHLINRKFINVQGNYIGTNRSISNAVANGGSGIVLEDVKNFLIGGNHSAAGNIIAGNQGYGILTIPDSTQGTIQYNQIGTSSIANCTSLSPCSGIKLDGQGVVVISDNTIQNTNGNGVTILDFNNQLLRNTIINNTGTGVAITATGFNNPLAENTIFNHVGLGIDLSADGVTANDSPDNPTGGNLQQNYPILSVADKTDIIGTLSSHASENFKLEFFASTNANSSGYGEGETFLGSTTVTTDASGNASFTFPYTPQASKPFITATATHSLNNNTSEFSATIAECITSDMVVTSIADSGSGSLRDAVARICPNYIISLNTGAIPIVLTSGQIVIDKPLTIVGLTGDETIDGDANDKFFQITPPVGELYLENIVLKNGKDTSGTGGGAILNLNIAHLDHVTLMDNDAAGSEGGAIWTCSTCTLNILNSSFLNNNANHGGAIFAKGIVNIANTSFFSNSVTNLGGGIYADLPTTVNLSSNTLVTNNATDGGGIYNNGGTINIQNTMIAFNTGGGDKNVSGGVNSTGYNLIDNVGSSTGWIATDITSVSTTVLNTPTATLPYYVPLAVSSPAIDAGNNAGCTFISSGTNPLFSNNAPITTDQIDATRPTYPRCDIGAIEFTGSLCQAQSEIPESECLVLLDMYNNNNGINWTDSASNNWNSTLTPCTTWTGVTCSGGHVTAIVRDTQNLTGNLVDYSPLTFLSVLSLSNNALTGSIPNNLPISLNDISLFNNNLTGNIPNLLSFTNLLSFYVQDNALSGAIPTLPNTLQSLDISNNALTGSLPSLPINLNLLHVNNNHLTGVVPTLPSTLTVIELQGNIFSGTFPPISGLTGLVVLDISYNAISATSSGEAALVASKQAGWDTTQTVAPINLVATTLSSSQIQLSWTPILYTADSGHYKIYYSTTAGGAYSLIASTVDKTINNFTVTGLNSSTTYYFVVATETLPHANNSNLVLSANSLEASATTLSNPSSAVYNSSPVASSLIDVGTAMIGTAVTTQLLISEAGTADLTVALTGITGTNASDFSIISPSFPLTLPDGSSAQTVTIRCMPSATGTLNATLNFSTNDTSLAAPSYPLQCTGTNPSSSAIYASTPIPNSTLSFGTHLIGTSGTETLTLQEIGNADLILDNFSITGTQASDFSLLVPAFPLTIADGSPAQTLTLHCQPSADGLREAMLNINTNDPTQPTVSYTLHCTGTTSPVAGYDSIPSVGNVLAIGSAIVGNSISNTLNILETGLSTLTISNATLTGINSNDFAITSPTIPFDIADGAPAQSLLITCTPSTSTNLSATLTLNTNDPSQPTVTYPLTCTGLPATTNQAPTGISLSNNNLNEGLPSNTLIGYLNTLDTDTSDTHTYQLLDNANGLISLIGNALYTTAVLNATTTPTLTIQVRSTDSGALSITQTFVITVHPQTNNTTPIIQGEAVTGSGVRGNNLVIDAPEHVTLTGRLIVPSQLIGKNADIVVSYNWHNLQNTQQHNVTVNLALNTSLQADSTWQLFSGNLVFLTGIYQLDFGYRLDGQLLQTQIIQLQVNNNRAPTAIQLSNNQVEEFSVPNQIIGVLSTSDLDKEDIFRYSLLDNLEGRFAIKGNQLVVQNGALINYSKQQSHDITIRSTDLSGASYEQTFTINVQDLQLPADTIVLTHNSVLENSINGTPIGRLLTPQHEDEQYQYRLRNDANGTFSLIDDILYVANSQALDYESNIREFTLQVESRALNYDEVLTANIKIQVQNVIDAQTIGQLSASFDTTTLIDTSQPLKNTDIFSLTVQTVIDRTHRGLAGEYFIGAFLIHPNGLITTDYLYTEAGWKAWDGRLNHLEGSPKVALNSNYQNLVWQGALTGFIGYVAIYSGYRVGDMTELVIGKPFIFQVTE
ncbi:fibronectin type III domain-containing protein [Beggiatoa alba B18LD]|uniref:Fibronectin type III domain-containing protein n=1 Tax=Beggiatoa alba B18LD TaxID=395493 RepID=I3CHI2_9GAMM|nr:choice-of-anchor D domain-containing protein [Beggiatoa alba]EIJ43075.1 fibronectin type III domain-containing protein [Beggiatoa alba B18LD]